jgi:integrase
MLYRRRRPDGSKNPAWYYDFQFSGKHYNGSTRETSKERARAVEDQRREEARGHGRVRDIPFGYTGDEKPAPLNLCDEYLRLHAAQKRSKTFFDWTVAILKRHFKERLLSHIGVRDVEEFLAARRADVKTATANRSLTVLKHMLRKAVEWGYAASNPAAGFKPEKERNRREFFLTADQADELLEKTPEHIRPLVVAALHTGARRGELLGLTWQDVDLDRRLVTFRDTKNGEDRTVRMSETLTATLRRLPSRLQGGPVFRSSEGKALEPAAFRKDFEAAAKGAGLKGFRFHDLRHSAASFLVQAGVPLNTVREILGHKSITMTLRYAHLAPEHQEDAAKAMDRLHASRSAKAGAPAPPA